MKKAKNIKILISIVFLSTINILSAQQNPADDNFFEKPLKQKDILIDNHGLMNNGIEIFEDNKNAEFLLKYQLMPQYTIHEVLGAQVGQTLEKDRVNKVIVAPTDIPSLQKFSYGQATLHTRAPGIMVYDTEAIAKNVSIREGIASLRNLESITYHEDLAEIVALHLYLNDHDGGEKNLFFDSQTNHFCAIDKACIFDTIHFLKHHDYKSILDSFYQEYKLSHILPTMSSSFNSQLLSTTAYDFLETIKKENLSSAEIKALQKVNTNLKILMEAYPPTQLHSKWMKVAESINFKYPEETKEDILILLEYNYHENKRLVKLIDKLTQ